MLLKPGQLITTTQRPSFSRRPTLSSWYSCLGELACACTCCSSSGRYAPRLPAATPPSAMLALSAISSV